MRVSKDQAAKNRRRVVEAAGKLFRERGVDGVGIDAIMAEAGLTHGGFYKMFASKEDLVSEACQAALENASKHWLEPASGSDQPLAALVAQYLSLEHRDSPGTGCALATMATEVGRRSGSVRKIAEQGLATLVADVEKAMLDTDGQSERQNALAAIATMVGGLVLARAVEDDQYSREILAAASRAILKPHHPPVSRAKASQARTRQ